MTMLSSCPRIARASPFPERPGRKVEPSSGGEEVNETQVLESLRTTCQLLQGSIAKLETAVAVMQQELHQFNVIVKRAMEENLPTRTSLLEHRVAELEQLRREDGQSIDDLVEWRSGATGERAAWAGMLGLAASVLSMIGVLAALLR